MFSVGKHLVALAALPLATSAIAVPTPVYAAESIPSIALNAAEPAPILLDIAAPVIAAPLPETGAETAATAETAEMDEELECMAKVVHHEAGNQPRRGQLAVAQLIMNRVASGRFAGTICAVANQRGQFFRTSTYNPPRNSPAWASAVEVSRQARDGAADEVAPGALFFHAAYASAGSFFRGRQRIATLGGNVFYR